MNPLQLVAVCLIRFYRRILSPLKQVLFGPGAVCRFEPSCSAYALESVSRHGLVRGGLFAARRLCRCHPWGGFGLDPVPPTSTPVRGLPHSP